MTAPGRVLEHHTLVVRDGRILDLLPTADAARYAATVAVQRPRHLLMPGMINSATYAAKSLFRGLPADEVAALERRFAAPEFVRDGVLTAIAEMLRAGLICASPGGLGLDANSRLAALGATHLPTPGLWLVGPPVRGSRFEATAVPELRSMAELAAYQVLAASRAQPVLVGNAMTQGQW